MANEYKLSFTAEQVNAKLGKIDSLATETYVNSKIAAIPTPDVSGQIDTHNTSTSAHNDIRNLIKGSATSALTEAKSYTDSAIDAIPAIPIDEIDEICNVTMDVYLNSIAAEGVSF